MEGLVFIDGDLQFLGNRSKGLALNSKEGRRSHGPASPLSV
jgi:hypothetical protein